MIITSAATYVVSQSFNFNSYNSVAALKNRCIFSVPSPKNKNTHFLFCLPSAPTFLCMRVCVCMCADESQQKQLICSLPLRAAASHLFSLNKTRLIGISQWRLQRSQRTNERFLPLSNFKFGDYVCIYSASAMLCVIVKCEWRCIAKRNCRSTWHSGVARKVLSFLVYRDGCGECTEKLRCTSRISNV